ncbi:hypothetical protein [Sodalis sp.]
MLPRVRALLDRDAPLPPRFALAPYFERRCPKHRRCCSNYASWKPAW